MENIQNGLGIKWTQIQDTCLLEAKEKFRQLKYQWVMILYYLPSSIVVIRP